MKRFQGRSRFDLSVAFITGFLFLVCLNLGFAQAEPENSGKLNENYVPAEILVRFQPEVTSGQAESIIEDYGCRVLKAIKPIKVYHLSIPEGIQVQEMVDILKKDSRVKYAEPNHILEPSSIFGDIVRRLVEMFKTRFSDENQTPDFGGNIQAPDNPNLPIVAVIDTGIDYNHPDFKGHIYINEDEIPGNGIDDDGNGYVDDFIGWNVSGNDNNPLDESGHGTHVSGIVLEASQGNCQIMPIRASKTITWAFAKTSTFTDADVAAAIIYAADNGAKVINMSLGGTEHSETVQAAIDYAYEKGVVIIAAAGNDDTSRLHYPAAYEHVLSVGAVDGNGERADFSNYGYWVDIYAPGVDINSTCMAGGYCDMSGTSMAAPYVAGIAAAIIAENPLLTPDEVYALIQENADSFSGGPRPFLEMVMDAVAQILGGDPLYGGAGIINPAATLAATPTVEETIIGLFREGSGRDPTQDELEYWARKARSGEASRADIEQYISGLPQAGSNKQEDSTRDADQENSPGNRERKRNSGNSISFSSQMRGPGSQRRQDRRF
ncbi:MAG: S8 family serine peptidase [Candidatus Omnitrophica bacterium]|nr:S8 family serine peptidase [Candidatus Omnitrophota bacterium]